MMKRMIFLLSTFLMFPLAYGQDSTPENSNQRAKSTEVLVATIDGVIHPVSAEFLLESIEEAERVGAEALVVELNTPGGLMTSMQKMTTAILESAVPVVVYVSPDGAQAASAGFFVLISADIAAMAPGSNTGAAHPVGGQGEDIEGHMGKKVEEDAAANIRSLAERQGRNIELAEAAVIDSRSYSASEALEGDLIDFMASDLEGLLRDIDGFEISRGDEEVVMHTADASIRRLEMTGIQEFLALIVDPNIAALFMTLGLLGLVAEVWHPGSVLPGVMGSICLILALYAFSVLPVNAAGVALILLSIVFFVAEIKVPSFGVLGISGIISLVLGLLFLFKGIELDPEIGMTLSVDPLVIGALAGSAALFTFLLGTLVIRAHRTRVSTGYEGMVGAIGVARTAINPKGTIDIHGEIWTARSKSPVLKEQEIKVIAAEGLSLTVEPVDEEEI